MKLDEAIRLGKEGEWREAQVRVNPSSLAQWFVMLHDGRDKSFILADEDDKPIATDDLNQLVPLIQSVGLKDFTVFL